jgi:prepilin-type N-terminal cleavage/methylation domain-containing protein
MRKSSQSARGFTLLELMIAVAIFLVVCAAMFSLLQLSQQRYSSESQMSGSFGEARLGIDQMVRDINVSGYPSLAMFSTTATPAAFAISPFAWDPGYTSNTTCQIGVTCTTPGQFDLIIETNFGTSDFGGGANGVSWIHYQLGNGGTNPTTLYRGVVSKSAGTDPVSATIAAGVMTPFVENVMNNVSGPLLSQITAQYPNMFSSGPVPIFQYTCNTPTGPQSCTNPAAAGYNTPKNVSDVDITLIVKTPLGDSQTHTLQVMELTARGHRSNPTY